MAVDRHALAEEARPTAEERLQALERIGAHGTMPNYWRLPLLIALESDEYELSKSVAQVVELREALNAKERVELEIHELGEGKLLIDLLQFVPGWVVMKRSEVERLLNEQTALRIERDDARAVLSAAGTEAEQEAEWGTRALIEEGLVHPKHIGKAEDGVASGDVVEPKQPGRGKA